MSRILLICGETQTIVFEGSLQLGPASVTPVLFQMWLQAMRSCELLQEVKAPGCESLYYSRPKKQTIPGGWRKRRHLETKFSSKSWRNHLLHVSPNEAFRGAVIV